MNFTKHSVSFALLLTVFTVAGCSEIKTSDAKATYKYWAGTSPPVDIELLNGQYWQSAHWAKEYIMYLKLKPSKAWWIEFIKQDSLMLDTTKWARPNDSPNWFLPTENSIQFRQTDIDQDSRYFQDTTTGICYIYEIQL